MTIRDDATEQEVYGPTREGAASLHTTEAAQPRRKTGGRRKKRRGAPLGNQNARKHGYYSKLLTPEQLRRLPKARAMDGFDQEIVLMRLKMGALLAQPDFNFTLFFRAMASFGRMFANTNRIRSGAKQVGIDSSL